MWGGTLHGGECCGSMLKEHAPGPRCVPGARIEKTGVKSALKDSAGGAHWGTTLSA